MKKILLCLFILFFVVGIVYAADEVKTVNSVLDSSIKTVMGKAVADIKTMCGKDYNDGDVESCTTAVDTLSTGSYVTKFGNAATYAQAQSWLTSDAYCLCKITLPMAKIGTPSGTISIKIYSYDTAPNELLGTSSTLDGSTLTTSYVATTFTFSSCINLSATTQYYYAAYSDTLNDTDNYFAIYTESSGGADSCGEGVACRRCFYDGAAWGTADSTSDGYITTYE